MYTNSLCAGISSAHTLYIQTASDSLVPSTLDVRSDSFQQSNTNYFSIVITVFKNHFANDRSEQKRKSAKQDGFSGIICKI